MLDFVEIFEIFYILSIRFSYRFPFSPRLISFYFISPLRSTSLLHRLASLRLSLAIVPFSVRCSDHRATASVALQIMVMANPLVSIIRQRSSIWCHGDGPEAMLLLYPSLPWAVVTLIVPLFAGPVETDRL